MVSLFLSFNEFLAEFPLYVDVSLPRRESKLAEPTLDDVQALHGVEGLALRE